MTMQGGFARVYEVADVKGGRHAIKVVTKSSLNSKKSKTKVIEADMVPIIVADPCCTVVCGDQAPPCARAPQHRRVRGVLRG